MPNHKSFLLSLILALVLSSVGARAGDPLDDLDGTEGWDQVVQPRQKQKRQADLERSSFKQEVEGWEAIRQAWQEERETYIAEKSSQQRMFRQLRTDRRPPPEADITENSNNSGEWGDQPGESVFQPTGSIDRAIDDELGESGAVPAGSTVPTAAPSTTNTVQGSGAAPEPYTLRRERDREEDRKLKAEQEAARKIENEKEQQRQVKLARKKKEEDERLRKEQEAQAGEAAAAALLKQQEEQMRKEQEALRKKAKLNVDTEGQVVDPELQREMQDEPDSEEDSGN